MPFCFFYTGSACCRHVQFFLKRRRLCPLFRNGEFTVSTSQHCCCMTFRGNVHSCRVAVGRMLGKLFVFTLLSCTLLLLPRCVCLSVSVALRSSGRLPQKVSHCSGECLANHPGSARYNICKHALSTHTCLTQNSATLLWGEKSTFPGITCDVTPLLIGGTSCTSFPAATSVLLVFLAPPLKICFPQKFTHMCPDL